VRVHRALRAAGVEAELEVYEGQSHAQYLFDDRLPRPRLLLVRWLNSSTSISASNVPPSPAIHETGGRIQLPRGATP
jgi:acetyl esterase/lipase